MAWVETRANGTIRGGYRDARGHRRYVQEDPRTGKPFRNEATARRVAEATEQNERERRHRPRDGASVKCGAWLDEWYPARGVEDSTSRGADSKMRHQVRPRWDDVELGDVQRLDVQRWVRDLERAGRVNGKPMAASGVRQCYYLLRSAMSAAVAHGMIDYNPCQGITLPALPIGQERYLTDAEQGAVFHHLDGVHRVLVELLAGTGLRVGEACGLHWDRVDLDRGVVDVVEVWDVKGGRVKAYPKSRKRRTVPLTDGLVDLLWRWQDRNPPGHACGRPHAKGSSCRSTLALVGPKGAPVDPSNFSEREWKRAVDLAGIGHARVHDLRHTYASRLLTRGVRIERVSKLLGHGSVKTTERYAHFIEEGHDEVRAALSGGAPEGTGQGTAGGTEGGVAGGRDWTPRRRPRAV